MNKTIEHLNNYMSLTSSPYLTIVIYFHKEQPIEVQLNKPAYFLDIHSGTE